MVENIALKILLRQGYLSTENNEISTELKKKNMQITINRKICRARALILC